MIGIAASALSFVPLLLGFNFGGLNLDVNQIEGPQQAVAAKFPLEVIDYASSLKQYKETGTAPGPLLIDESVINPEGNCEFCIRVDHKSAPQGQAGIVWESSQKVNLGGSKRLVLFAMGETGGEKVKFKALGKELSSAPGRSMQSFHDINFASTTDIVILSSDWKRYEVEIPANADLTSISQLFGLEIDRSSNGKNVVIYLKGIVVDENLPEKPLPRAV